MKRLVISLFMLWNATLKGEVLEIEKSAMSFLRAEGLEVDFLGSDKSGSHFYIRVDPQQAEQVRQQGIAFQTLQEQDFVSTQLSGYKNRDVVLDLLYNLEQRHPRLVSGFQVGLTTEGYPIKGLILSNQDGEIEVDQKPAILFNGMHHAREVMTTEVVVDIAEHLLQQYERDEEVKGWLDRYRIIVVPQVNPDGNAIVHDRDSWWRKNAWKQRDRTVGVDLNRNYPGTWNQCGGSSGQSSSQDYRGPQAGSEPETQAMMRLIELYKPIFNISYHSFSELIIYPFGCRDRNNDAKALFHQIGQEMNQGILDDQGQSGTYRVGTAPELLYEADGTDLDYQWHSFNVMAYTIEVNSRQQGFQPNYNKWRDKTVANQRGGWKALLRRLDQSLLVYRFQPESSPSSYQIFKKQKKSYRFYQSGRVHAHFPMRSQGLMAQLLEPGIYKLVFYSKSKRVFEFEVDHQNVL